MNGYEATGMMVLLFALRCVAPFVLLMGIGYFMNRMVDKWERDALAEEAVPEPQSGQIFSEKPGIAQPAFVAKSSLDKRPAIQLPCWMTKQCDPATRAECAANQQRGKPCWVARLAAEGVLPLDCPDCPVYQAAHT
ncbi:MAG: hypothetical protein M5U34_02770 [Chloroflexi bacterium]|nr:hypothetical protein [Chloroflexota bacterium]